MVVIRGIEAQLVTWNTEWQQFRSQLPTSQDSSIIYRKLVGQFYFQYGLLLLNSFGLQNALDNSSNKVDAAHFFAKCHSAAAQCAVIVRDELVPRGFLRYSPDSHFVLISYAVLTLLKLSLSEFCKHLHNPERTVALVKDVAECLEKIAVGPQHTPALYATFLRALIAARPASAQESQPQAQGLDALGLGNGGEHDFIFNMGNAEIGGEAEMSTNNLRHFDFGLGLGLDLDPGAGTSTRKDSNAEASILSGYLNTMPETTLYQDPAFVFDPSQPTSELSDEIMAGFEPALVGPAHGSAHDNSFGNGVQTPRPTTQLFPASLGEMGPPTETFFSAIQAHSAAAARGDLDANMISMDSILSPNFWDNILIPGFSSTFEGLSGGMVYGANGSGLITPRANSPGP